MAETDRTTRRDWLAKVLMGGGLALAYGVLAVQGVLFLLPGRLKPRTRRLFAGQIDQYRVGGVQTFHDLQGNEILVKRSERGFEASVRSAPIWDAACTGWRRSGSSSAPATTECSTPTAWPFPGRLQTGGSVCFRSP